MARQHSPDNAWESRAGHVIARIHALKGLTKPTASGLNYTEQSMTLKNALITGLAVAGLLFGAGSAMAQGTNAAAAQPASTDKAPSSPEQNWLKVCAPADKGQKACIMRQVVLNNGNFLGSFLIRDDPGQQSRLLAVAAVPVGVMLPFDMIWQIDDGRPLRVPYVQCDPQSCASMTVINEAYVNSLKKGNVLKLTAKARGNKDIVVQINLAGFTSVYDSDTALTFDQFRKDSTGANALEQALQDQAEQIRRQKEGDTTPAPAPTTGN